MIGPHPAGAFHADYCRQIDDFQVYLLSKVFGNFNDCEIGNKIKQIFSLQSPGGRIKHTPAFVLGLSMPIMHTGEGI